MNNESLKASLTFAIAVVVLAVFIICLSSILFMRSYKKGARDWDLWLDDNARPIAALIIGSAWVLITLLAQLIHFYLYENGGHSN